MTDSTDDLIKRLRAPLTGVLNLVTVTRKSTGEEIEKYDPLYREAAAALEAERLKRQQAEHERDCILEDLAGVQARLEAAQARIDALMLEHCPNEMTPQQIAEYERNQRLADTAIAQEQKRD